MSGVISAIAAILLMLDAPSGQTLEPQVRGLGKPLVSLRAHAFAIPTTPQPFVPLWLTIMCPNSMRKAALSS